MGFYNNPPSRAAPITGRGRDRCDWHSLTHKGGGAGVPPWGSDLLQVAAAAGVVDQATQRETQQVGGGDHLSQAGSEGGSGIEPVGAVGVALKDHLYSGAVDLNVGDGAALLNGEGAEDRSGGGGHRV